jgi:ABC-type sugar transport system ATPase subunit
MPDIVLTDVRKTFPNGVVGLLPTTLRIAAGEYFVLLGPSGSGKSTLLRLIAGLETPDGGTIRFGDRPVHGLPPNERGIAFVPQRSALYPDRDVRGNIRIGLELEQSRSARRERLTAAEIDDRVRDAAELLGIPELLGHRAHELSGGQQRRVMLARALVRQTPILLLDEPLGQIDSGMAEQLSRELHLLQRRSRHTILHVTHDPIEAMALADRVGLLGGGRILQTGTPDEVYARPGSRTVGLHFGRPAIALIDGAADGTEFKSLDDWLRVPCPYRGPLTLGVRPEDVAFGASPGFMRLGDGGVAGWQWVGGRVLVTVRGPMVEVRGFADCPPAESPLEVWVRVERLNWFDAATGNRV